jgi:S1-C subfamily serine protease
LYGTKLFSSTLSPHHKNTQRKNLDGDPIIEADELSAYVRELKQVDNNITLTVFRNGDYLCLNATLEASPY